MKRTSSLRRVFRIAAFRRDVDAVVNEELTHHLELKVGDLVRAGWSPTAAREEANRSFGNYDRIRGECTAIGARRARKARRMERLGQWGQDLAYGLRQLKRSPSFAVVAIATLALGVGATTAIFSVVNGVLLNPLPYSAPDGLVRVWVGGERGFSSYPDIVDLDALPSFESLIGISGSTVTLTGLGDPMLLSATRVSEGILETFQLPPLLGRDVRPGESGEDAARVAVIAFGLWQRLFDGDPQAVGRTVEMNSVTYEIIGVAPEGFDFPSGTEVWVPRRWAASGCGRGCHTWRTVGRLAPGATLAGTQAEVDVLAGGLSETYPESNFEKTFRVVGLQEDLVGDVRRGLFILLGSVAAVLLIACANVANLLLVRSAGRAGEMAVRGALGATRSRLVRQLLVESALLAVIGGAIGLIVAAAGVWLFRSVSPGTIPRIQEVTVDLPVVGFALSLVVLVTMLFGLRPALRSARVSLVEHLTHAGRGSAASQSNRPRRMLVTAEVALSVVLLIAAGLLLRSFGQLYAVDLGYETERVSRFTVSLPSAKYETIAEIASFYSSLEDNLLGMPGAEAVGSVYGPPLGSGRISGDVLVEGRPEPAPGQETSAEIKGTTAGYLQTMRIPVVRGRGLTRADLVDGVPVAVVSETFVRENFPAEDPLGKRVQISASFDYEPDDVWWTIVGVVRDLRGDSPRAEPVAEFYVPHSVFGPGSMSVAVRHAPGLTPTLAQLREQVVVLDPDLPLRNHETVSAALAREVAPTRFYMLLVALFAGLAVLLAGIGLYGVLAFLVAQRTREIGVRAALGADRVEILRMVILDGARPAALGIFVGLLVAILSGRFLEAVLFGVRPWDPVTLAAAPLFLAAVALTAIALPAWRAARIDPAVALRSD